MPRPHTKPILADTIVVGGGVAGLYAAWRLLKDDKERKLILLEALDRVGGRLDTSIIEMDGTDIQVEQGGMRFLDKHHHLSWLLKELNLSRYVVKFGMGDKHNLFFLRGTRFTRRQAKSSRNKIWSKLYKLDKAEAGKSPSEILRQVRDKILEGNVDPKKWSPESPYDWRALRTELTLQGTPIYKWGFRALLAEFGLSNECVSMLIDSGGFACPYTDMINAGSAFQLFGNFPENPDFHTLRPGYQVLPETIRSAVKKLGGSVETNQKVIRIEKSGSRYVVITSNPFYRTYCCTNLILALPARPLTQLTMASSVLNSRLGLDNLLQSVSPMPLTKINLYYKQQWWRKKLGIKHGGCFTDLPLSQVYFFEFSDVDKDSPAAITIYCDSAKTTYWKQLQLISEPYMNIDGRLESCSQLVVKHIHAQLKLLFDIDDIPLPMLASYKAWGSSGAGEGDHQWKIGVNDKEISEELWQPLPNVYICGEAFSDEQAWVEGALRSTELVLQRGFELKKPRI